jgi:aspartate aminotransferase-like enzyme
VSSLGAVDTSDLGRRLFLATGVSGKALASYAGLAFVFLSQEAIGALEGKTICPTFDMLGASRSAGPVSTVPSPLVMAALAALRENYSDATGRAARFRHYDKLGRWARARMREVGLELLVAERDAAPTIATFPLPPGYARACMRAGFCIAHESDYLRARGWGQIATMGNLTEAALEPLFAVVQSPAPGRVSP